MKEIQLTQGKVALVDDEDYARVVAFNWYAKEPWNCLGWYAARNETIGIKQQRTIYLHAFILNFPDCAFIDHINRDTLDDQKHNLRIATTVQSAANRELPVGVSGYRGVTRSGLYWIARIAINGNRIYLGTFDTPEEAATAYDVAALQHHGEFAVLNFQENQNG